MEELSTLSPAKEALRKQLLRTASRAGQRLIPRRPDPRSAPLSFAQHQMWVLDQMRPGNPAYNLPVAFRLLGPLNVAALEESFNQLVRRHEALRTTFATKDGELLQFIQPDLHIKIDVRKLEALPGDGEDRLLESVSEFSVSPFDLSRLPLIRILLIKVREDEHALVINIHHIVADGISIGLMFEELNQFYQAFTCGGPAQVPELPIQYGDFALWQHRTIDNESAFSSQIDFWRENLGDTLPVLELPIDKPRPACQSFNGSNVYFSIPGELAQELILVGARQGCTLFMTVLAAFQVLLQRYSGAEQVVMGTPIGARTAKEVEPLIGNFLNMMALRCDLAGDPTFNELLRRTRDLALKAFSNGDMPFGALMRHLKIERDPSRNPFYQVMLEVSAAAPFKLGALEISRIHFDQKIAQLDLSLHLWKEPEGYGGRFEYCTDLFERETIERLSSNFQRLLCATVRSPEQKVGKLPILAEKEERLLRQEWNDTRAEFPAKLLVHELFERQVDRTPQRTALRAGGKTISYEDLDARANRIAHALRLHGINSGKRVGVCLVRGADMVAAALGVLKTGAAYVPLDPSFPEDRLRFMAEDAQIELLVSSPGLTDRFVLPTHRQLILEDEARFIGSQRATRLPQDHNSAQPGDAAYVIYTSGSTGKPKGVVVPHRAVVNFLTSMAREPGLTAEDVVLAVTTLSFDIAVLELFLPLTLGAVVVVATQDEISDGHALASLVNTQQVTVMQGTPSTYTLLCEAGFRPRAALKALVGGEPMPVELANKLIADGVELWNMYGPTETTVWSTCAHITNTTHGITIGKPIANTLVRILDGRKNLCPVGVHGELCIGGLGVALGYWNRPELTAEHFIPDRFSTSPGATLYCTGDRARWRNDGTLEILGRLDFQVKIRGFRIEPGEIEAAISKHPAVREVAVVARDDVSQEKCLVAYVGSENAPVELIGNLRALVRATLPEYMVPGHFVILKYLPRTHNGKLDRKALPPPTGDHSPAHMTVRPRTASEEMVMGIFRTVLGRSDFGLYDSFFDLGGNSLMAARIMMQMRKDSGCDLPLRVLFERPTVSALAATIDTLRVPQHSKQTLRSAGELNQFPAIVPLQPEGKRPPIFAVPGHNGDVFCYRAFAQHLGPDQPFYGLHPPGLDGRSQPLRKIEELTAYFAAQIRAFHRNGPYIVAGFCAGGTTAFELARHLTQQGATPDSVCLFGCPFPTTYRLVPMVRRQLRYHFKRVLKGAKELSSLSSPKHGVETIKSIAHRLRRQTNTPGTSDTVGLLRNKLQAATISAVRRYIPNHFPGRLILFSPSKEWMHSETDSLRWKSVAQEAHEYFGPAGCNPDIMLREPYVRTFAELFRESRTNPSCTIKR